MKAVLKHELSGYFHSLTAYVFGAFLLVFVGIGSMLYNIQVVNSCFGMHFVQKTGEVGANETGTTCNKVIHYRKYYFLYPNSSNNFLFQAERSLSTIHPHLLKYLIILTI